MPERGRKSLRTFTLIPIRRRSVQWFRASFSLLRTCWTVSTGTQQGSHICLGWTQSGWPTAIGWVGGREGGGRQGGREAGRHGVGRQAGRQAQGGLDRGREGGRERGTVITRLTCNIQLCSHSFYYIDRPSLTWSVRTMRSSSLPASRKFSKEVSTRPSIRTCETRTRNLLPKFTARWCSTAISSAIIGCHSLGAWGSLFYGGRCFKMFHLLGNIHVDISLVFICYQI